MDWSYSRHLLLRLQRRQGRTLAVSSPLVPFTVSSRTLTIIEGRSLNNQHYEHGSSVCIACGGTSSLRNTVSPASISNGTTRPIYVAKRRDHALVSAQQPRGELDAARSPRTQELAACGKRAGRTESGGDPFRSGMLPSNRNAGKGNLSAVLPGRGHRKFSEVQSLTPARWFAART
jgi:hypothetical protein